MTKKNTKRTLVVRWTPEKLQQACYENFTGVLNWPVSQMNEFIRNYYQVKGLVDLSMFELKRLLDKLEWLVNRLSVERLMA